MLHALTVLALLESTNLPAYSDIFARSNLFEDPRFYTISQDRRWFVNTNVFKWRECAFANSNARPREVALCFIVNSREPHSKPTGYYLTSMSRFIKSTGRHRIHSLRLRDTDVSGQSKPAREGRMKTSHFESGIAQEWAKAALMRDEPTHCEPATDYCYIGGQRLVGA